MIWLKLIWNLLSLWNAFVLLPLCLSGVWVCVPLRTLSPPQSLHGLCSSVCCWAPAPCWSKRRASLCLECVRSMMLWCSAASLSSSKHSWFFAFFMFCLCCFLSWFMWPWSSEHAHGLPAILCCIFTQLTFTPGNYPLQPWTVYFRDKNCTTQAFKDMVSAS